MVCCSFGVTVWEMMTRKRPFSDMMSYQVGPAEACYAVPCPVTWGKC